MNANAEKQRRFRESMKGKGYKQVLRWELPVPDGMARLPAVIIHESTIDATSRNPVIKGALIRAVGAFWLGIEQLPENERRSIMRDFERLLEPLGILTDH
jgi:hypothetical protein